MFKNLISLFLINIFLINIILNFLSGISAMTLIKYEFYLKI